MRTVGFIGAYDKIDLILYIAKLMVTIKKKVLVIDATITQKAKYIIPAINPTKSYVTEFEGIDVAVGFDNYSDLKSYLSLTDMQKLDYDIVLIDVDNIDVMMGLNIKEAIKKYFVTGFDLYSLKKGLEIIREINDSMEFTKVLYARELLREDNDYLDFLSSGHGITWSQNKIFFPLNLMDQSVIMENQRVSKLKFKKLSEEYKSNVLYMVEDILTDVTTNEIKRAFKNLEREE